MEQEDRDRLTRVEMKLDMFTPLIPIIEKHDRDLAIGKRLIKFIGTILALIISSAVAIFSRRQH